MTVRLEKVLKWYFRKLKREEMSELAKQLTFLKWSLLGLRTAGSEPASLSCRLNSGHCLDVHNVPSSPPSLPHTSQTVSLLREGCTFIFGWLVHCKYSITVLLNNQQSNPSSDPNELILDKSLQSYPLKCFQFPRGMVRLKWNNECGVLYKCNRLRQLLLIITIWFLQ